MNGRTCQLCGKALSRFTVGSGGDFCSREHRNQFRLRVGMDRLLEANKVASLMRRRENAKAIPAAQLTRDSKVQQRAAPPLRLPVRQAEMHPLHLLPAVETPRIASRSASLFTSRPGAVQVRAAVRSIEKGESILRSQRPLFPPRIERFQAKIVPAGAVFQGAAGQRSAERRPEAAELRLSLHRTHIGGNGIQVRRLRTGTQNCQEPQQARGLTNSADRGRDLRVSGGIGFRLPAPRIRSIEFTRPHITPPVKSTEPRGMGLASRQKKGSQLTAGVLRFCLRGPSGPTPPKPTNGIGLQWPDAIVTGTGRVSENATDGKLRDVRACDVRWIAPAPVAPQLRHSNGVARMRSKVTPPSLSAPPPHGIESTRRLTLVSFQPPEAPFECAPSLLYGTLLGAMHGGAAPLRKVEPAPVTLEEHFDAGLHNWMGGIDDWKVDVAGVRAGSLALYSPSMEIPNYLLEFLTRIELRGVTWVFRAANLNDYFKATVVAAADGGYEFRRCLVTGGSAEAATVRVMPPASPAPTGKTAVTLRTRVTGNDFTVSLDGQVIDTWTDARLTAGGIGFVSAPQDRARLYWVKVTPIGHTSKEYSKR
jgi:hypothetical protein